MKKKYHRVGISIIQYSILAVLASTAILPTFKVAAGQETKLTIRGSGLPVPRFVSLKFNKVNLRSGPGSEYPVLWQYRQIGLPLLVDAEFGVWRKVRDADGTTGWMHSAGLSPRRMAFIHKSMTKIYKRSNKQSDVVAVAEKHALLKLESCPKNWCRVAAENVKGWVERASVWGVLDDENLN